MLIDYIFLFATIVSRFQIEKKGKVGLRQIETLFRVPLLWRESCTLQVGKWSLVLKLMGFYGTMISYHDTLIRPRKSLNISLHRIATYLKAQNFKKIDIIPWKKKRCITFWLLLIPMLHKGNSVSWKLVYRKMVTLLARLLTKATNHVAYQDHYLRGIQRPLKRQTSS